MFLPIIWCQSEKYREPKTLRPVYVLGHRGAISIFCSDVKAF